MRLAVITGHRASVISNLRWEYLDLDTGIWTIPERNVAEREDRHMKSGERFISKLPEMLLAELRELHATGEDPIIAFSVN